MDNNINTDFQPLLTLALPETPQADPLAATLTSMGVALKRFAKNSASSGAVPLERWVMQLIEGEFDDVLFTSAQGVHLMVETASQLEKQSEFIQALGVARKIVRGRKPAQALSEFDLKPEVNCRSSEIERLIETVSDLDLEGRTVGIQPFDSVTESKLADLIEGKGGSARLVAPTTTVDPEANELLAELINKNVHAICFLTERTAAWLFDACRVSGQEEHLVETLRHLPVLAAEAACSLLRRRGIHPDLILSHATIMTPVVRELSLVLGLSKQRNAETAVHGATGHRVVIAGNGMVGYKLCDELSKGEGAQKLKVTALGDESIPAYDRVHLSEYFSGKSAEDLFLEPTEWYEERNIDLRLGTRVSRIDRETKMIVTNVGEEIPYDSLILATGAEPFLPPVPGLDKAGVFVYRTIEDLVAITEFAKNVKSAAVIGGGLLGLEAAKAAKDLGLQTHVIEMAPRLMPRQLDDAGSSILRKEIEALGVEVHLGARSSGVLGAGVVSGLRFADGEKLEVDMIIVSAGIKPRDDVAAEAGLTLHERGGVLVDNQLRTSDPSIYAVGECAIHENMLYGLVAPGYEMARCAASIIRGEEAAFTGADMSTKLKLLGVEVGSLGDPFADQQEGTATVVYQDLVGGVYKKLIVSEDGKKLLGAILVGETSEFGMLLPYAQSGDDLPVSPDELLLGSKAGSAALPMPETAQICSCNNVTRLDVVQAIDAAPDCSLEDIKSCTKAGTGCGGCLPVVTDLFNDEMSARGNTVKKTICEHFDYSRQELFDLVKVKGHETFRDVIEAHGKGHGCEICKPVVASVLATTTAAPITNHAVIQDTNDRFLANIQRRGLYSVVPRIPAGEITPDKLIVLGQVAKKYGLYTKITGGQRVDLFGARVDQLPDIWEELVNAGFESGHAYGKSLRTVKSCVGTTWCRYGVQDSVGFAVKVENRYKGLRSPHKLKSAVSGCTRECAEAQSKDFGLIATENGWNLYVCGNGGTTPRHADLLASDVDEETVIRYIDRFLMYYIKTADKLNRTSVWVQKLEGGIEHVKDVVVHDSLGIAADLERDMQALIDAYVCEWADVVRHPEKRAEFKHFAGESPSDTPVEMVVSRGQRYPAPWPATASSKVHLPLMQNEWVKLVKLSEIPEEGGTAVRYGKLQLAVFHLPTEKKWYVTQNMCPHKRDMILARGLVGDQGGIPKVACPIHKKTFNLVTGDSLSDDDLKIATFRAREENGWLVAELPSQNELEKSFTESECTDSCATAAE
ncbi:MAG: nitrite reductase large subunit NirB [Polyangiaceae bacterium]|nr:nitrite reductase large subunit NirB [Polyangiaceae bacterium]